MRMGFFQRKFAIFIIALASLQQTEIFAESSSIQKSEFVRVDRGHFYLRQKPFRFIGGNMFYAMQFATYGLANPPGPYSSAHREIVDQTLDAHKSLGMNVVRIWANWFGEGSLHPSKDQFNENAARGLDYVLEGLRKRNMKAILVMSDTWGTYGGGIRQYSQWCNPSYAPPINEGDPGDTFGFYTLDSCKSLWKKFALQILSRKNTINNSYYSQDSTIFSWDLLNEARPAHGNRDAMVAWVKEMATFVRQHDSQHLVAVSHENSENCPTHLCSEATLPHVDYGDLHIYPFEHQAGDISKAMDRFRKVTRTARGFLKPVIAGEFAFGRSDTQEIDSAGIELILKRLWAEQVDGALIWSMYLPRTQTDIGYKMQEGIQNKLFYNTPRSAAAQTTLQDWASRYNQWIVSQRLIDSNLETTPSTNQNGLWEWKISSQSGSEITTQKDTFSMRMVKCTGVCNGNAALFQTVSSGGPAQSSIVDFSVQVAASTEGSRFAIGLTPVYNDWRIGSETVVDQIVGKSAVVLSGRYFKLDQNVKYFMLKLYPMSANVNFNLSQAQLNEDLWANSGTSISLNQWLPSNGGFSYQMWSWSGYESATQWQTLSGNGFANSLDIIIPVDSSRYGLLEFTLQSVQKLKAYSFIQVEISQMDENRNEFQSSWPSFPLAWHADSFSSTIGLWQGRTKFVKIRVRGGESAVPYLMWNTGYFLK